MDTRKADALIIWLAQFHIFGFFLFGLLLGLLRGMGTDIYSAYTVSIFSGTLFEFFYVRPRLARRAAKPVNLHLAAIAPDTDAAWVKPSVADNKAAQPAGEAAQS